MAIIYTRESTFGLNEIRNGGAFLIDKPLDWTSFDVVNKVRGHIKKTLDQRKFKVGHAGTLDPRATGLLIVCFGKATKEIESFQNQDKEYTGTFYIGATTPTYDTEAEIDHTYATEHLTDEVMHESTKKFLGIINQKPPIFSAIKKDGIPMYKRARAGEKVEIKTREVRIDQFDLTRIEIPHTDFIVKCKKGTYIRSLAYDYGVSIQSGAYLHTLRRTKIGDHNVNDATDVLELCDKISALRL